MRSVLLVLAIAGSWGPSLMAQQPEAAVQETEAVHRGGEANLILPDLGSAEFMGINGRSLLMGGLLICALGISGRLVAEPLARRQLERNRVLLVMGVSMVLALIVAIPAMVFLVLGS